MKVYELIDLLERCQLTDEIKDFDVMWMNLNIQEPEEVETIEINSKTETVLIRQVIYVR